ncbi:uncharacterized protein F5Z01DRAFT_681359 [Emericellopsis atlantica]|uniref:FAD-binding PCMH-type domain-containing protein n=1 Tax=Emericellopsis atlantica TaxID=2614577 RepID=A0A9P7ZLQ9_9HYPO|nr:uncharacterized protein F5Z01DRAFT_681359 [Emericellopsis atlantica]KAG9254261.1 hypothetical protein F5Z01DRAFT_681359 [Emericellopsis atlantica]
MVATKWVLPLLASLAAASPFDRPFLRARQESLNACLEAANLTYVDEGSATWEKAIQPHNLRVPVTPRAIVYPTSAEEVQAAVLCAVQSEIKVAAKSGGHSYASMGLGGQDGSLVIQLDRWHEVTLREDNTATVTAGTRLGYAALELFQQGKRGFSHGTCPSVGSGGHIVHGGFGFSSHTHGLALDAVIGVKVVLADGSLVYASATENTDLFWAIRGGGSSFGIVTEFEIDTFDVAHQFSWFTIETNLTSRTKADAVAGLMAYQSIIEDGGLDKKLNMRLGLGATTNLEVVFHGPEDEAREALEPFMLRGWAYGDPLNITDSYSGHYNSYVSSLMTKHIPEEAFAGFVDYWFDVALADGALPWWAQMDVHGDPQGAIANAPSEFSSYAHRDKLWLFQFSTSLFFSAPGNDEAAIAFTTGMVDSLKDSMDADDWGRYANYVDSELEREVAQEQYFSTSLDRLMAVKAEYDPDQLFWNPQSIDPAE